MAIGSAGKSQVLPKARASVRHVLEQVLRLLRPRRAVLLAVAAASVAAVLRGKRRLQGAKLEWLLKRLFGRFLGLVLPIPVPRVVDGAGCIRSVGEEVRGFGCQRPLIVTDAVLVKHGLVERCIAALRDAGLSHELFDEVTPNPPSELVEEGYLRYVSGGCDCLIAFGGGSPMDTAKVIGAKVANPSPSILDYEGFFNVNRFGLRPLPPLLAVPTTAGTGSETTVCAVITETRLKKKVVIADLGLVPQVALLDPEITEKLPRGITSSTGLDALTHAIEAYIGDWSTEFTRESSLSAVAHIFGNITSAYENGSNMVARQAMLRASFEGGLAFTRANIGYCHAIAHQLGGMFHTAHGVANAMLLPIVLHKYLDAEEAENRPARGLAEPCAERLRDLAVAAGVVDAAVAASEARQAARLFVERIQELSRRMSIETEVPEMKASDVPEVAQRALLEAHGESNPALNRPWARIMELGYPVPRYFNKEECEEIVARVLPATERRLLGAAGCAQDAAWADAGADPAHGGA